VKAWLDTPFEGGRHERRIEKIERREVDSREELERARSASDFI